MSNQWKRGKEVRVSKVQSQIKERIAMQKGLVLPGTIVYKIAAEDTTDGLSLAQHLEKHFHVTRTRSDNEQQSFHASVPVMRSDDLEQYLRAFVIEYEYVDSY